MSRVLILSHADTIAALPPRQTANAMAAVLAARARNDAYMPLRSVMRAPGAPGLLGLMPAWGNGAYALKAVVITPENPARGLDAHQGTVTLFDGATGIPTAILDGSAVTAIRTAAVTAVATDTLATPQASTLAIIGAGVQAKAHLEALAPTRRFTDIRIYSPTAEHAQALSDNSAGHLRAGARISVSPTAEEAVRAADVVVLATSSKSPVIERAWLAPGAHVNAIGASIPSAREIDVDTVAASALFCDSRESLENEAGEYRLAREQGLVGQVSELGDVLAGLKPGRATDDDRQLTLFRSLGIAVEDLAAAQLAVANARQQGLGTEVEL